MNYKFAASALGAALIALAPTLRADPLNERQVAPEAKWLIHIDCDNLRQTQVGGFLFNKVLVPKVTEMSGDLKLNISNALERINSLTAYGSDFKTGPDSTGVLLINCDSETQKALEGVLVAQILANTNGPVRKLDSEQHSIYSLADQVFVSPQKGGPIVVSKSEAQIDATRERLSAPSSGATLAKTFGEYPVVSNSFFFVGLAGAVDLPHAIPAQAKVLQMADGGRVALGERGDQLFVNLSLRGKTAEVAKQIQQVVEGMVALVTLGQPDNPDIMSLAKSTSVASADQVVTICMEYPAEKAIAKITEEISPKPKHDQPPRDKAKAKAKSKKAKKQKPQAAPVPAPQPEEESPAPQGEAKPESEAAAQPPAHL